MVRRHFIAGDEKPDFIITYYAPQHIPFSSNYKGVLRGYFNIDNFGHEDNTVFKCVLDKWKDGVGEYGIKILNWVDGVWYNMWGFRRFVDLQNSNVGSLGVYIDIGNNVQEDIMLFSDTITDVIFPNEIKHLIGPAVSDYLDECNRSVVNITLPENLETLSNHVLRSLHVLKTITIPSSVIYMGDNTLKIDCENDNIMSLTPGNQSLEEIIMKPIIPPSTDTFATPIGVYRTDRYINPNLKIRVYADCIDAYKNDAVWGQYSDLYDIINNAIVYYTEDGSRKIYEQNDVITNTASISGEIKNATYIHLPNSVTTLSLENYSKLKQFVIPNSVTNLHSISNNNALEELTINNNVIDAEDYAISKCANLKTLVFNNGNISLYTVIDAWTKSQIKHIIIGNSVMNIQATGLNNLTTIVIDGNNPIYDSREQCNAIIETATNTLIRGCKNTTIPDGVTSIGDWAFSGCSNLTSITIPNSVTKIELGAFSNCSSLTSIVIPDSVTSIGEQAFYYCYSLTSVGMGNSVTSIGTSAFSDCYSLTSVVIGNSVTSIEGWAFLGCTSLTDIVIPNSVMSIGALAFYNCKSLTDITYQGTIAQWEKITLLSLWHDPVTATVVHCTDGDITL